MAYDKKNNPYVSIKMDAVFGDNKAYTLSMGNSSKVRLAITSKVQNNGTESWDFRNSMGISFSIDDASRLSIACKQMASIYITKKNNPTISTSNPIYATDRIAIPLVNSNRAVWGTLYVGLNTDDEFYVGFTSKTQDGNELKDFFVFKPVTTPAGFINFFDANGNQIKSSPVQNVMFANFIRRLDYMVSCMYGPFGLYNEQMWKNRANNGASSGGFGGAAPDMSTPMGNPGDMPF